MAALLPLEDFRPDVAGTRCTPANSFEVLDFLVDVITVSPELAESSSSV